MASFIVILIIAACAALLYLKGTVLKALATLIAAVCASIVAFGFFELLANVFIKEPSQSEYPSLMPWAQPLCFVLLFIITFAVLQTLASILTKQPVDLGFYPERIGRVICGILLGLFLSGLLLTALAMAPLPNNYPYQRFDERIPNPERPSKVFLNADGFATGWFSMVSDGSLAAIRNPRSFSALHPAYIDQLFLNRHNTEDDITLVARPESIEFPRKSGEKGENGAWLAPKNLQDTNGQTIPPKSGHTLIIVRAGLNRRAARDARLFTLSQLRLVCKRNNFAKDPFVFVGKAWNFYPIGYITRPNTLEQKKLNEKIEVELKAFDKTVWIDFAFYVPDELTPVHIEFKQNSLARVPHEPVQAGDAPPPVYFVSLTDKKADAPPDNSSDRPTNDRPANNRTDKPDNSTDRRTPGSAVGSLIYGDLENRNE